MPTLDKTGPQGQGPLTGRKMGLCGKGRGLRVGIGFGRYRDFGRGLGRYFGWSNSQTKEDKVKDLKAYQKALGEEMENTDKELADLGK